MMITSNSLSSRLGCCLLLVLGIALSGCSALRWGGPNLLQRAEEYTRQGEYAAAIEMYEQHIEERLALDDRPQWENPYFYLLLIGDLHLRRGDTRAALAAYELAEEKGIERGLVSDRYRYVARWYEQRGELQKAVDLLLEYRNKDPLLMEAMLDRLNKEIVRREDRAVVYPPSAPLPAR